MLVPDRGGGQDQVEVGVAERDVQAMEHLAKNSGEGPELVARNAAEGRAVVTREDPHRRLQEPWRDLEEELKAGVRVLAANALYAAVLPFASHVP